MTTRTIRQFVINDSRVRLVAAMAAVLLFAGRGSTRSTVSAQIGDSCANPVNRVVAENCLPGDAGWDLTGGSDPSIQGFATDISVAANQTVTFKIATDATSYAIDIYRLGYYNGAGARKVASSTTGNTITIAPLPQSQPQCLGDPATGLFDCGNWAPSATWDSTGALSGIYVAKLIRTDAGSPGSGTSHIVFVVRDDVRHADLLFQTSDTTWQAYNQYGGGSLYCGGPFSNAGADYQCATRSAKVSYNRPFDTRDHDPQSFVFNAEYPMVRWLEANGYDVSYFTGVDAERSGAEILNHKVYLSVGHDEYWSGNQRASVSAARDAGVNLAFFSGNEMFWKTRWEASIDGSGTPNRTLVSYKETIAGSKIDPAAEWTGTWRDPTASPPSDGGRPENALTGTLWTVNCCTSAIVVPAEFGAHRFWRNSGVDQLAPGTFATLTPDSLGYEWDADADNGVRPDGLVRLSSTTVRVPEKVLDYGVHMGPGVATHALTLYRKNTSDEHGNIIATSLVFGAGSVQWSWGLDGQHDRGGSTPDVRMQQATVNLFGDMGAQPGSLQSGLQPAFASSDNVPPTSTILSPIDGGSVEAGTHVTISGTASDAGGVVAGVDVSVDGGGTWHRATGAAVWSYDWTPQLSGTATIKSRAIDDSGNVEIASAAIGVTVSAAGCNCNSLWDPSTTTPTNASANDSSAYELGVKFYSDISGFITSLRFYKGSANTGTHIGNLWTASGTLLATATFTNETSSGWQTVEFGTPVPIVANTTYVASYRSEERRVGQ